MIDWAKKTWISALLIAIILTALPSIPRKELLAIFAPLIIGTVWTKIDSRGENHQ